MPEMEKLILDPGHDPDPSKNLMESIIHPPSFMKIGPQLVTLLQTNKQIKQTDSENKTLLPSTKLPPFNEQQQQHFVCISSTKII